MPSSSQIRAVRKTLGQSQSAFGSRFGVVQSTVARWEQKGISRGPARMAIRRLIEEVHDERSQPQKEAAQ